MSGNKRPVVSFLKKCSQILPNCHSSWVQFTATMQRSEQQQKKKGQTIAWTLKSAFKSSEIGLNHVGTGGEGGFKVLPSGESLTFASSERQSAPIGCWSAMLHICGSYSCASSPARARPPRVPSHRPQSWSWPTLCHILYETHTHTTFRFHISLMTSDTITFLHPFRSYTYYINLQWYLYLGY